MSINYFVVVIFTIIYLFIYLIVYYKFTINFLLFIIIKNNKNGFIKE